MDNSDSSLAPLNKEGQTESLTAEESSRLGQLEEGIERTIKAGSVAIGNALKEIRDSRLYRARYRTFEEYARIRWNRQRSHAYRLIDFAKAVADERMSPKGETANWRNESSYRASKIQGKATAAKSANAGAKPKADKRPVRFWLAHFKGASRLALLMGHTKSDLLFRHYRALVKPIEAAKWWKIYPNNKSNLIEFALCDIARLRS